MWWKKCQLVVSASTGPVLEMVDEEKLCFQLLFSINRAFISWAQSPPICFLFLFCAIFFFFASFPSNFASSWEVVSRAYSRRSGTAERRRSSKSHNQYEAVYSAGGGGSATPDHDRPQCLQSDRVRRVTFNGGGFIKQRAFVFAPCWINKRPAERLLRYLHPHKDKTTSRRKRIMGSGDPS